MRPSTIRGSPCRVFTAAAWPPWPCACEAVVVPTDPQQPPRSLRAATVGFVRGTEVGDLVIEVESVREGRLLTTSHVTTIQGGKVTTVSRFHHSAPSTGTEFSDVAPALSQPSEVVDVADWERPRHITKVDTLMSPSTVPFAGADRAQWLAWSRPVGTGSFGAAWLLMYGDYFPPAVFVRSSAPSRWSRSSTRCRSTMAPDRGHSTTTSVCRPGFTRFILGMDMPSRMAGFTCQTDGFWPPPGRPDWRASRARRCARDPGAHRR